jgi:hypothetical protein
VSPARVSEPATTACFKGNRKPALPVASTESEDLDLDPSFALRLKGLFKLQRPPRPPPKASISETRKNYKQNDFFFPPLKRKGAQKLK